MKESQQECIGLCLGHFWEELQVGLALTIQRVHAGLDGVHFEQTIHSQTLSGGSQNVQQSLRQSDDEEQSVSSVWVRHPHSRYPHSEAPVLDVAEPLLNREAATIQIHDGERLEVGSARRQTPCLLHSLGMFEDYFCDLCSVVGDACRGERKRPAVLRNELSCGSHISVAGTDKNGRFEANDEVNLKRSQKQIHGLTGKSTISQKRDANGRRKRSTEPFEKIILDGIAENSTALDSFPKDRSSTTVTSNHGQSQRALVVFCKVCPVERNHDIGAISDDKGKPRRSQRFEIEEVIAKQPIDLFDGVFGAKTASLRKASANVGDARSGGSEGAKHGIADGAERPFVKVSVETVMKKGVRSGIPKEWMGVHERSLVRDSFRAIKISYQIADFSSEMADSGGNSSNPTGL